MKKKSIVVVCPGGASTGGVELLHQFVHELNNSGAKAGMLYYPFGKRFEKLDLYAKYDVPVIDYSEAIEIGSSIILPEIYTYLIPKFFNQKIYIWWMSVDNYINSKKLRFSIANRFLPWNFLKLSKSSSNLSRVNGHFYQSEYARLYLQAYDIRNVYSLSDYINEDYLNEMVGVDYKAKKNIVVYNPAKGIEQTKMIISSLKSCSFVPIINMSRLEVKNLLKIAKVYIDFGNHPGKDRIPREAVAMGCCLITNRRGSAANIVDINIPDKYKIDDTVKGFESKVASLIEDIFSSYEKEVKYFDEYKLSINSERYGFNKSVNNLIDLIDLKTSN